MESIFKKVMGNPIYFLIMLVVVYILIKVITDAFLSEEINKITDKVKGIKGN